MQTKKITFIAVFSALSVIFAMLIHFPIFPAAPFLQYDAADIPIFLCAYLFGPSAGMICTVVVCVLQGVTVSADGGFIGILMHLFATGSYVLAASLIFKKCPSKKGIILSAICGIAVWIAVMVLWNIVMTPIFMGTPREAVIKMLIPVIVPFNAIKAGINATLSILAFYALKKPIQSYMKNKRFF